MSGDRRRPLGAAGERIVAEQLKARGYDILAVNWRCRVGEIDVIASKDGTIAFVEVRSRSVKTLGVFGAPLESVTPKKRYKVRRVAEAYLQQTATTPARVRFDCAGVVLDGDGHVVNFDYVEDAF